MPICDAMNTPTVIPIIPYTTAMIENNLMIRNQSSVIGNLLCFVIHSMISFTAYIINKFKQKSPFVPVNKTIRSDTLALVIFYKMS